jgi:hypothetical protein
MAKDLKFDLVINTSSAENNLDDVSKSLDDIQGQTELDLKIENAKAAKSLGEVKKAMRELRDEALRFEEGTEEYIRATDQLGKLQNKLGDLNSSMKSFSGSTLQNVNNSFADLRKNIFTLNLDGISRSFGNLSANVLNAGKSILGLGKGLNVATLAARGFAVALAATGITLIIAAVAILINSFDDLSKAGGIVGKIFESIGNVVSFLKNKMLELLDTFGLIDKAALDAAEAQKNYMRDLEDEYDANADSYDELTKSKMKADLDYLKNVEEVNKRTDISEKRKNELIESYNKKRIREIERAETSARLKKEEEDRKLIEAEKKKNEEIIKLAQERQKKIQQEREKAEKKELDDIKEFRLKAERDELDRFAREGGSLEQHLRNLENIRNEALNLEKITLLSQGKDILEIERQQASDRADIRKKNMEDDIKIAQEEFNIRYGKERLDLIKKFQNGEIESKQDLNMRLKNLEINRLREEASMLKAGTSERIDIETKIIQAEIDLIDMKKNAALAAEDEIRQKMEERMDLAQTGLAMASDVVSAIGDILAQSSQNRIDDIHAEENARIDSLEKQFKAGIINEEQLNSGIAKIQEKARKKELEEKKKAFEQSKAIQITQAVINTAQAVIAAFTAGASMGPAGVVMGPLMAALAGALGGVQIGLIASQKFPDGGSAGGSRSVGSIPSAPSMPSSASVGPNISFSGAAPGSNIIQGGMTQQPIVVQTNVSISESEITGTQEQVSMYEDSSALGGG